MLKWLFAPLILSFAAVSACGGNDSAVEKARGFTGFDVWWLGEEFEGFKLSNASATSFLYGTCKPGPDAGCAPPIQVGLQELCSFGPLDIEPSGAEEEFRGGATLQPIRDGQTLVRTGTVAITLFGRDDATTRRMAARLASLNLDPPRPAGESMPAPAPCPGF